MDYFNWSNTSLSLKIGELCAKQATISIQPSDVDVNTQIKAEKWHIVIVPVFVIPPGAICVRVLSVQM